MRMCLANVLARNFAALVEVVHFALTYLTLRICGSCPAGLFAIDFFTVTLLNLIPLNFFYLNYLFNMLFIRLYGSCLDNRVVCPFCTRVVRQLRIATREQGGIG